MILLDEVDAHLDEGNVSLLTKFIGEMDSQVIMISHKVSAVSTCSSLIGVTQQDYYRAMEDEDLQKNKYVSAVTYNLDLTKFN